MIYQPKIENISHRLDTPGFSYVACDVSDKQQLSEHVKGVDIIYHRRFKNDRMPA